MAEHGQNEGSGFPCSRLGLGDQVLWTGADRRYQDLYSKVNWYEIYFLDSFESRLIRSGQINQNHSKCLEIQNGLKRCVCPHKPTVNTVSMWTRPYIHVALPGSK